MQFRNMSKIFMALLGLSFSLVGALNLWISYIGDFKQGRTAVAVSGAILLMIGVVFLSFPFSRLLSKILGAIAMMALAGALLFLVFGADSVASQPIYQIAAITLAVLVVARVFSAFRSNRLEAGT